MRQMYIILASVGWVWLAMVGAYLLGRFSKPLPPSEEEQINER